MKEPELIDDPYHVTELHLCLTRTGVKSMGFCHLGLGCDWLCMIIVWSYVR